MKNLGICFLVLALVAFLAILGIAAMRLTSDEPHPELGTVKYIWAGAMLVLLGVIGFFVWLALKNRPGRES